MIRRRGAATYVVSHRTPRTRAHVVDGNDRYITLAHPALGATKVASSALRGSYCVHSLPCNAVSEHGRPYARVSVVGAGVIP